MRVLAVLLLLLGIGWLGATLPAPRAAEPAATVSWRRTRDGWQPARRLAYKPSTERPIFHPAFLAGAQLLFAVSALVGLSPEE